VQARGDLGFHWIAPDLALGGCVPTEAVIALARCGPLRVVVDLREEACDDAAALAEAGIALLHLPTPDHAAVAQHHLQEGVHRLRGLSGAGEAALLHCQHGIGRSALLALCVLVDRGMAPLEALNLIKACRQCVSPSPAQYEAWVTWLRGRGVEPPTFDAFAAVAYRHLAPA